MSTRKQTRTSPAHSTHTRRRHKHVTRRDVCRRVDTDAHVHENSTYVPACAHMYTRTQTRLHTCVCTVLSCEEPVCESGPREFLDFWRRRSGGERRGAGGRRAERGTRADGGAERVFRAGKPRGTSPCQRAQARPRAAADFGRHDGLAWAQLLWPRCPLRAVGRVRVCEGKLRALPSVLL